MRKLAGIEFIRTEAHPFSYNFRKEGRGEYSLSLGVTKFYLEIEQWMSKVFVLIPAFKWKVLVEPWEVDTIISGMERKVANVLGRCLVTRRLELIEDSVVGRPVNFNALERKIYNE